MTFINPDFKFIKYGRRKIKVKYKTLLNCYGEYDPNKYILYLDQNIKGEVLFNTIVHELFHIIIAEADIDVNQKGEEPIAQEVGDGYTKIFKQNPKLWDLLHTCLFGR